MASPTYALGFNPIWYFVDENGKPLGAGYLATYSSLNPDNIKLVYTDINANFPWPYVQIPNLDAGNTGILINANGSQGPFYFQTNALNSQDTYDLYFYDLNGVQVGQVLGFTPPGTGGGGGGGTTVILQQNLITNNVMWRNLGTATVSPGAFKKLAPGAHAGLAQTANNAGPDIVFFKDNISATDTVQFPKFNLGATPFNSGGNNDVTPVDYFQYNCTIAGSAETKKVVQFPICRNVQNLSGMTVSIVLWANLISAGANQLTLSWRQYLGDGVEFPTEIVTPITTFNLTSGWDRYSAITKIIPAIPNGTALGACGNDALFIQVGLPLDATCSIAFTKLAVYLGSIIPTTEFITYDNIDAVINAPRTGYVFGSYDLVAPPGYIIMNDGTIGQAGSGASTYAATDSFPLYNWLYTNVTVPSANALCTVTGYTGNVVTDFLANRVMNLPVVLGRALASAGNGSGLTARALASIVGTETHTLSTAEVPNLSVSISQTVRNGSPTGPGDIVCATGGVLGTLTTTGATTNGGGGAHSIMQPTSFLNYFIKL